MNVLCVVSQVREPLRVNSYTVDQTSVDTGEHQLREFIIKKLQKMKTYGEKRQESDGEKEKKNIVNSLKYMFSSPCSKCYIFLLSTSRDNIQNTTSKSE